MTVRATGLLLTALLLMQCTPSYPPYPAVANPAYATPAPATNPARPAPPPPPPAAVAPTRAPVAPARQWSLRNRPVATPLYGGANHYEIKATSSAGTVTLDVIVFDSRRYQLRVIDQPSPRAGGGIIGDMMKIHRAAAGVNGGFFSPEFGPVGLMIASGRSSGSFQKSGLLTGAVLQRTDQPYLIWNAEYQASSRITDLLQAGPRLVDSRSPVPGLNSSTQRNRTFVATDGGFMWGIGVAKSVDLAALSQILCSADLIPDLSVMRALNLDGGRSSALWMRTATGKNVSKPGWSTVRNYLAIVPR